MNEEKASKSLSQYYCYYLNRGDVGARE